jgi:hypothetical protein
MPALVCYELRDGLYCESYYPPIMMAPTLLRHWEVKTLSVGESSPLHARTSRWTPQGHLVEHGADVGMRNHVPSSSCIASSVTVIQILWCQWRSGSLYICYSRTPLHKTMGKRYQAGPGVRVFYAPTLRLSLNSSPLLPLCSFYWVIHVFLFIQVAARANPSDLWDTP